MSRLLVVTVMMLGSMAGWVLAEEFPLKEHPNSKDWPDLFGPDLAEADFPKGVWYFENGVLTAKEDRCIWTKKQYENFILDLEFKNAPGSNSGVFVYCSDPNDFIPNSVEIQICDDYAEKWAKMPRSWHTGAIFGHQPATEQLVNKAGQWNRMTIVCKGPMIYVMLNGKPVNTFDMRKYTSAKKNPDGTDIPPWLSKPKAELPTKGHIGLQGKHGDAPIYFRNLKIKPLE
ncbi:MAG: DUF1080 domain-containing protein [Thermoguttaceae bacterium]|nr:DUF1080 domain-containing protein [Thermoguttaceae bacterium]